MVDSGNVNQNFCDMSLKNVFVAFGFNSTLESAVLWKVFVVFPEKKFFLSRGVTVFCYVVISLLIGPLVTLTNIGLVINGLVY